MSPTDKQLRHSKLIYYIDELSILLFVMAAVVVAEAFVMRSKGQMATLEVVYLDWLNLIISGVLAIIAYSGLHTVWKYNDKSKLPYMKRVVTGISQGIMWRTIIGWSD